MTPMEKAKQIDRQHKALAQKITAYDAAMEMYQWAQDKIMQKAETVFCYANCTEPTKKGCKCENTCKEFLIFKRKLEE